MNRKKILLTFIMLTILMLNYQIYASNLGISTYLQQIEKDDKTVEVKVTIKEMSDVDGINAYSGELVFNSDQLELIKIEGTNIWNTPSYNPENAAKGNTKVVSTSSQFTKESGTIFTAIFNKKTNNKIDEVKFNDFEAAAKSEGKIIKVKENTAEDTTESTAKTVVNKSNHNENNNSILEYIMIGIVLAVCFLTMCLCLFSKKDKKEEK